MRPKRITFDSHAEEDGEGIAIDIIKDNLTLIRMNMQLVAKNKVDGVVDSHAEEDCEGIANKPGNPKTKQSQTLLPTARAFN